jgi:hypothetical protein
MMPETKASNDALLLVTKRAGLLPISLGDAPEIQNMLTSVHEARYASTWTYLTQAVNGYGLHLNDLGYLLRDNGGIAFSNLFVRPTDGQMCWHLVSPLRLEPSAVAACVERLRSARAAPVYLKKVNPDLAAALREYPGFADARVAPWHPDAILEDDTYPEVVAELSRVSELMSTSSSEFANKLRRFDRRIAGRDLQWCDVTTANSDDARQVIQRFFEHKQTSHVDISEPADYENMLRFPAPRSGTDFVRQILYADRQPLALLVLERIIDSTTFGLYCNISLYPELRYLSEAVVSHGFELAAARGAEAVNMGGSESVGLDTFKRKFGAADLASLPRWLVYEGF